MNVHWQERIALCCVQTLEYSVASIDQHPEMNLRSINEKIHGTKEHAPRFH